MEESEQFFHMNQKWVCCTYSMAEAIRETLHMTVS